MLKRTLGAAVASALLLVLAAPCHADIVELKDGTFLPKGVDMEPGGWPTPAQLKDSGKDNVKLSYDAVTVGRDRVSASQVLRVWSTEAEDNSSYNDGLTYMSSNALEEAAQSFSVALDSLKGETGREVALYWRLEALRTEGRDAEGILAAADALIAAFPKSFWFGDAHMIRARVFAVQGKLKESKAALAAISAAPGMNPEDYFESKLAEIQWFDLPAAGKDAAKLAKVEAAYRTIANTAKSRGDDARIQYLKALVGAGRCLVFQGKFDAARKELEGVTNDNDVKDKRLLGAAYRGLGDAIYGKARADVADPAKRKEAVADLNTAAMHYLRVTEFYGQDYAADEMVDCTENLARVFANLFLLGDGTDCALGSRAYESYRKAWKLMGPGQRRNQLSREALDFKRDYDAKCKKPETPADGDNDGDK
jgi:tetratricopeptide (TPR) repeat protein